MVFARLLYHLDDVGAQRGREFLRVAVERFEVEFEREDACCGVFWKAKG